MTQDLLLKFKFFQDIRMWPKNSDFDYGGWLENFSQDEQKIAQKILDFFVERQWIPVNCSSRVAS